MFVVFEYHNELGITKLYEVINKANPIVEQTLLVPNFTKVTEPDTITTKKDKLIKGELFWLTSFAYHGTPSYTYSEYQVKYDLTSKNITDYQLIYQEPEAIKMISNTYILGSKVQIGSFFYPKFSRYGVNCRGCTGEKTGYGNFAVGIGANVDKGVRQFDGNFKKGITFNGYYIVASDKALPLCTVLRIENHNFKGAGLTPNVPFYAVVLDRGGAIINNRLDFYIGDERIYNDIVKYSGKRQPKAVIVYFGKRATDASGKRSCRLPNISELEK